MANIGYIRVSTVDQNTERQVESLKKIGMDKLFVEKISGATRARPELNTMLSYAREGDEIFCIEISRLARSCVNLLEIVDLCNKKGVIIHFLKENIKTDSEDPFSAFFLVILAALAQLERDLIKERSLEGIKIAKMEGRYTGRKPLSVADFGDHYDKYMRRDYKNKSDFARAIECSRPTLDKLIAAYLETQNDVEADGTAPLITLPKQTVPV